MARWRRNHKFSLVAAAWIASVIVAARPAWADEAKGDDPKADAPASERILAAVRLGLPLVQQAAARYPEHRKCFSCHHQTLPLLSMVTARQAGLEIDEKLLADQAEFTHKSFERDLNNLREGKGIGGKGLTVGYGLWTLRLAKRPGDEVSAAMVTYLLKLQQDDGHWELHASRPPMEDSLETCTALAVAALKANAAAEQQEKAKAAIEKAKTWLIAATPKHQEDKVARLWALHDLSVAAETVQPARDAVLAAQRSDGGWAQTDEMESDAYATGLTLCVLLETGTPRDAEPCQHGLKFLLDTQRPDGSWFVKTRSKPVQVYFDNGDLHGKDQFISTPATCWALAALAQLAGTPASRSEAAAK